MILDFFKKRCLMLSLVFVTMFTLNANAGLISETVNLSGGTSFNDTFLSFDSALGHLDSVVFSYDVTFSGTIVDNLCVFFSDCDGTRTLQIGFNGSNDLDSVFIDNNQFSYGLLLNVNDVVNFSTSDFTSWTSLLTPLSVSTSCSGDCFNGLGNAQLSGTATLSYEYTEVPEPSTIAIFALGLMGLASSRFKKQS